MGAKIRLYGKKSTNNFIFKRIKSQKNIAFKKNSIFAAAMTSNNTLQIDLFAAARSGQKQNFSLSDSFLKKWIKRKLLVANCK